MARHIEDEVEYYYNSHSTQEDLMGETAFHRALVSYLVEVLKWLFHGHCAPFTTMNIYQTANYHDTSPDVAVIKGVVYCCYPQLAHGQSGAPQVVLRSPRKKPGKSPGRETSALCAHGRTRVLRL